MPGVLGQPPAVLALHRRQQPQQQLTNRAPGLRPGEPYPDTSHHLVEHPPPTAYGYAVPSGRHEIILTVHNRQ